jgi:hypothetical protein
MEIRDVAGNVLRGCADEQVVVDVIVTASVPRGLGVVCGCCASPLGASALSQTLDGRARLLCPKCHTELVVLEAEVGIYETESES